MHGYLVSPQAALTAATNPIASAISGKLRGRREALQGGLRTAWASAGTAQQIWQRFARLSAAAQIKATGLLFVARWRWRRGTLPPRARCWPDRRFNKISPLRHGGVFGALEPTLPVRSVSARMRSTVPSAASDVSPTFNSISANAVSKIGAYGRKQPCSRSIANRPDAYFSTSRRQRPSETYLRTGRGK